METLLTAEQRDLQINSLEKRRDAVAFFAKNIATPGWIESQWAEGIRKGGQRLALASLPAEARFARLADTVIPLQLRLIGEVLPTFEEKIAKLQEQKEATPTFAYFLEPVEAVEKTEDLNLKQVPIIRSYLTELQTKPLKKALVEKFLDSPIAQRILNAARLTQSSRNFGHRFAGAIWEAIGFYDFKERLASSGQYLLNPDDTFALYSTLYPEREIVPNIGLNLGLDGKTLPDGLVIKRSAGHLSIEGAVDYKSWTFLNGHGEELAAQINSFQHWLLARDLKLEGPGAIDPLYHSGFLHMINPNFPADLPLQVNHDTEKGINGFETPVCKVFIVVPQNSSIYVPGGKFILSTLDGKDLYKLTDVLQKHLNPSLRK